MGVSTSVFSEEEMEKYQEHTGFTKKEILHTYKKFSELANKKSDGTFNAQIRVPMRRILAMKELKVLSLSPLKSCIKRTPSS